DCCNRTDETTIWIKPAWPVWICRRLQSHFPQRLDRCRLSRDRSGADHRHDRELPRRVRVGNDEEESPCRAGTASRRVSGRVAGRKMTMQKYDMVVIGGGNTGLAAAYGV